jgi:hypothetical protein
MRNINFNAKKAICSICVIVTLWLFGVRAATLPPDPDNAALLYYQAFLLLPDPNMNLIYPVLDGAEPDEKVREYIEDAHKAIELAEAASKIPDCTWGIIYSQGLGANLPQLEQCHCLTNILNVEARILAADGEYLAALEKCLTILRLAQHIGNDTLLSYVVSLDVDTNAQNCIKYILGIMPPDTEILTWLKGRLASMQGAVLSPARALEMDLELILQSMRNDPNDLLWLREQLAADNEGNDPEYIWNLTDEELLALIVEPYADFLDHALGVIDSEMPYDEKCVELQRLTDKFKEEFSSIPGTNQLAIAFAPKLIAFYSVQVRHTAQLNALKTAIEIYLATANSGRLPDMLPDYLPKDPFSGEDFEYEITEDGFILRCRAKDMLASQCTIQPPGTDQDVVHEYEFELQMQD